MKTLDKPRVIQPDLTFRAMVDWIHDELVMGREAPGFIVGLSGTDSLMVRLADPLVAAFEDGSLNLREFDHRKHVYVAWYYLKNIPFGEAVGRYAAHLFQLLNAGGYAKKFDLTVTENYFHQIEAAMKRHPTDSFDELMINEPELLISKRSKTSA